MAKLLEIWRNLEPRGQIAIVGAAIAVLATMFLLFTYSSRPSYVTLQSGLTPGAAGDATKALADAGISYKLAEGGTAIDVKDADSSQARVALAEKNLLGDDPPGFELLSEEGLGVNDFQQKVDYQRALEGEITKQITKIEGINSADVQLVLHDETLFDDESSKATASIVLHTSSQLDSAAVAGIAHLVSSGVKTLDKQKVTITDAAGTLLWPTSSTAGGTSSNIKLQAEQNYSSTLGAQINALLATTLGAGKAQARVHADLNVDQRTIDRVTYAKKGTPLQSQKATETLKNKGAGGGGAPSGAASNIPTYTAGSAANGNSSSNYLNKTDSTTYGVDKSVEHTEVAPGEINRLDVALLVDKSVPAAQVASLKATVGSLAGINAKRGDTLAVSTVSFAAQPKVKASPTATGPMANPLGLAKYVVIGLGAIIFLFLMRRGLKRREGEDLGVKPTWLREIEATVPLSELEAAPHRVALDAGSPRSLQQQAALEEIVTTQPQRIASQVGSWMRE